MKNVFLKLLACLLVAAMLISIAAIPAVADEEEMEPFDVVLVDEPADTDVDEGAAEADPGDGNEAEPEDGEGEGDIADEPEEPVEGEEPAEGEDVESDEPAEGEDGEAEGEEEEPAPDVAYRTDEEVMAQCKVAAENDAFILYYDEGTEDVPLELVGVYVKAVGEMIWLTPINAYCDDATTRENLMQNRMSILAYEYGNATDQITSSNYYYSYRESTDRGNTKFEVISNGLKITYNFRTANAIVPTYIILEDDCFYVYIDTDEINEKSGYKEGVDDSEAETDTIILTDIAIAPHIWAAEPDVDGYMLVADGSGAVINYNNGKGTYSDYTQDVYGRDITQVKEVEPDMTEQAYLPVMGMARANTGLGLLAVATDGDTFASANASVAYSKTQNSWYNNCFFNYNIRSTDNYYMTGDSSAIIVFEKGDGSILVPRIGVKYFPIISENDTVTYGEFAEAYRNYLIDEEGLTVKEGASEPALYIDFYGGTRKSKSILGIPIALKTAFTTFEQATEIVDSLKTLGVDNIVVNYNDWSEDSMSAKIDTGKSIASVLGGKSAYKKMLKSFAENGVDYYATVSGLTYKSNGNGFWTLFNTAYRVSKSYSRQYSYNIAYGTPNSGVAPALLSPRSVEKLSNKVTKNLGKYDQGAGLGLVSTTLWSDFSNKYRTNRSATAEYVINYYKAAAESNGKVIADSPNAYLLPYVNRIKNLTLQSSQFKLSDVDIPFYQMVIHGYVDYASEAVNGTPDTTVAVLKAIAAGSNLHFDFIYEEASEIVNTDYVTLFYAHYKGWLEEAANAYKLAKEVLTPAVGATIEDYEVDGNVITTTYSNGYKTVVDLGAGNITANGKTYNYNEYVKGGLN